MYYLQSRYYNPEWGRFINADALVSTGQGILGNNMFAYCLNNPVLFIDPAGERVEIWRVLFEDHNPGYLHNAVRDHIIASGLVKGELYLPGIGRADIFDPETLEIWEIKHGGSTPQMQTMRTGEALAQINRYTKGAEKKLHRILRVGHAGAFTGGFIVNYNHVSYLVTYDTPEPAVILYYVQALKEFEHAAAYSYVKKEAQSMMLGGLCLAGIGTLAGVAFGSSGGGLLDPLLRTC